MMLHLKPHYFNVSLLLLFLWGPWSCRSAGGGSWVIFPVMHCGHGGAGGARRALYVASADQTPAPALFTMVVECACRGFWKIAAAHEIDGSWSWCCVEPSASTAGPQLRQATPLLLPPLLTRDNNSALSFGRGLRGLTACRKAKPCKRLPFRCVSKAKPLAFEGLPTPIKHFKGKSKQPSSVNAGKKCWDASARYFGERQ